MSAPAQTKIFGINVGVDPKFIAGGLLALALLVWFFSSRSDNGANTPSTAAVDRNAPVATYPGASRARAGQRRNRSAAFDRGTLRIRPVDATRGDVDPTLRLDMLERLRNVSAASPRRSLFEIGPGAGVPTAAEIARVNKQIEPGPMPPGPPSDARPATGPQVNIPLKFYGFAKPAAQNQRNRGLFMNGDDVVVASEGDLIDHRYLVVELTPLSARMEDTQMKQGQTLAVVPEANQQ